MKIKFNNRNIFLLLILKVAGALFVLLVVIFLIAVFYGDFLAFFALQKKVILLLKIESNIFKIIFYIFSFILFILLEIKLYVYRYNALIYLGVDKIIIKLSSVDFIFTTKEKHSDIITRDVTGDIVLKARLYRIAQYVVMFILNFSLFFLPTTIGYFMTDMFWQFNSLIALILVMNLVFVMAYLSVCLPVDISFQKVSNSNEGNTVFQNILKYSDEYKNKLYNKKSITIEPGMLSIKDSSEFEGNLSVQNNKDGGLSFKKDSRK